jgi:hypothetical protein
MAGLEDGRPRWRDQFNQASLSAKPADGRKSGEEKQSPPQRENPLKDEVSRARALTQQMLHDLVGGQGPKFRRAWEKALSEW